MRKSPLPLLLLLAPSSLEAQDVEELLRQGYALLEESRPGEAAARARRALDISLRSLALLALESGDWEEGLRAAEQLSRLSPDHPDLAQLLGKLYYLAGRYPQSDRELSRAVEAADDPELIYTLALARLKAGQSSEAEAAFRMLEARVGDTAALNVLIGRAFRESADPEAPFCSRYLERAASEFSRAIERDPRLPRVHYYLALTYLKLEGMGAGARAVGELKVELENHPHHYESLFYLGLLLGRDRRQDEAIAYLERAGRLREDPDVHFLLGQFHFQKGRPAPAAAALEKCIELSVSESNPYQLGNAHYLLGRALMQLGRHESAKAHLKRSQKLKQSWARLDPTARAAAPEAVPLPPSQAPPGRAAGAGNEAMKPLRAAAAGAYQMLGRVAAAASDFASTASNLELAAGWDDASPDIYFNLGLAHLRAGDAGAAVRALGRDLDRNPGRPETRLLLEEAARSRPGMAQAHLELGRSQLEAGDLVRATANLETACRLAPSSRAFRLLALAYERSSRPRDAERARIRARELEP